MKFALPFPSTLYSSAILLTVVLAAPLAAQQAELSGFIQDPAGAAISGAKLTLQETATNAQRSTSSNEAGIYSFPLLTPGIYKLTAETNGFEKKTIENITIEVGARISRNVELAVGNVSQSITVSDSGTSINTVDAAVSTVVDRQFVQNIPLSGRSFNSLMTLVPGTAVVPSNGPGQSGGITVNGQRTESNYFTVDGVSASTGVPVLGTVGFGAGFSGSTPGETALGTTQGMVSLDALQEFRATTSTYSAEYGRSPGGQFSFTTRSGTNDFHGSLYNYFRNDALDANNWFSNATSTRKPATRQNNFGGTLSGPVFLPKLYNGRDRTFYFFSYEGLRLRAPQAGTQTQVPTRELRDQAPAGIREILRSFPLPNGADSGTGLALFTAGYSNPSQIDATAVRIDHSLGERFKIFGRYNDTPSSSQSRFPGNLAVAVDQTIRIKTATLGTTNLITPRLSNDARFNVTWNDGTLTYRPTAFEGAVPFAITDFPGYTDNPYTRLALTLNWGLRPGVSILPQIANQRQMNVNDTLVLSAGRHTLKFGADYRRLFNNTYFPKLFNIVNYSSAAHVLANQTASMTYVGYTNAIMRPIYENFSAFAQDDWRLNSRLSLSLGMRYEVNPAPHDANNYPLYTIDQVDDLRTTKLAPLGSPLWKTTYKNFAPRLGVAYQLRNTTGFETVLRGGVGIFYDTGNTQATDGYGRIGSRGQTTFNGSPFPLTAQQQAALPPPSINPPYAQTLLTDDPKLKLPYTWQWNFAVEQSLGGAQTLKASYVGAAGRRLLVDRVYDPRSLGNANFGTAGIYLTRNLGDSNYQALQLQFQRRLTRGLQVLASYTWSHAIDNATSNFTVYQLLRASADVDIRHNFQVATTYIVPFRPANRIASAIASNWTVDGRIFARSAVPVDVVGATGVDAATGASLNFHPNLVPGQPLYVDDSNAPGGRKINFAAFSAAPAGVEGNSGRNIARGFGAVQTDIALRRDIRLSERAGVQFRAEAFNIFNNPIFGAINSNITNGAALFGVATNTLNGRLGGMNPLYQVGGPRSMQLALRLQF